MSFLLFLEGEWQVSSFKIWQVSIPKINFQGKLISKRFIFTRNLPQVKINQIPDKRYQMSDPESSNPFPLVKFEMN